MSLSGVDVSLWSDAKERLLRHMFILDLIREFNTFACECISRWIVQPARDKETLEHLRGIIEKHKKSALYIIFTEEEKDKYSSEIVNTDEAIMSRVAGL